MKITRGLLREFIEAGLEYVNKAEDREALRAVARTATHVARGSWSVDGCGCPAEQAGLSRRASNAFAGVFDDETRDYCGGYPTILEVI